MDTWRLETRVWGTNVLVGRDFGAHRRRALLARNISILITMRLASRFSTMTVVVAPVNAVGTNDRTASAMRRVVRGTLRAVEPIWCVAPRRTIGG